MNVGPGSQAGGSSLCLVKAIRAQVTGCHHSAAVDLRKGTQVIQAPAAAANQADADGHNLMTLSLVRLLLGREADVRPELNAAESPRTQSQKAGEQRNRLLAVRQQSDRRRQPCRPLQ